MDSGARDMDLLAVDPTMAAALDIVHPLADVVDWRRLASIVWF